MSRARFISVEGGEGAGKSTVIAALQEALAAVRPADTRALYFVARGDGSSHFSASLDEHNAAVRRYQIK